MAKKYLWATIILLIIGGGYYWYKKTHPVNIQIQYVTATAEKGTLTTSVSGSGNVIVDQQSNIDPTITGTVANLAVGIGDPVKKGQLLFNIVNDQLGVNAAKASASLKQAKNAIDSAELDKKDAKATYDKAKKDNETTPDTYTSKELDVLKEKIDEADDAITKAEKDYDAALADYNNQQINAAKRNVTAPIGGTVNAVNIKNGDDLSKLSSGSSRQVPMIIGDLSTLKTQVQVNEVDIPNVGLGQKAMLKFDAIGGFDLTGKVEKMDSLGTITQGVVSYNVTISLDTLDPRIKPEMSVSAAIITGVKQNVLIVPNSAVKSEGNNYYIEVLNGKSPERKNVEIGAANNTDTEIISGISAGDKIITQTINPGTASTSSTQSGGGLRLPGLGGGGFRRD